MYKIDIINYQLEYYMNSLYNGYKMMFQKNIQFDIVFWENEKFFFKSI